jgi:alpha-L-fucosidase
MSKIKISSVVISTIVMLVFLQSPARAQLKTETPEQKTIRMKWWSDARFGMFIHWGIYALPARHEWVKNYEKISDADYQKYFEEFNPDLCNPKEWAKMAKEAGMKYVVLTTKHHDGFCLFESKFTDYKSTKTPFGKDIVKEYVEALRAEGLKVGFYYSLLDWHHPDYTLDRNHPGSSKSDSANAAINKNRDMSKYREYLKNQVRELLTNYGEISVLWFDFSFPGKDGKDRKDWDSEGLLKMVRTLQPGILVNERLDLNDMEGGWDFDSPEQFKVEKCPERNGKKIAWETCQTFSGSWGYHRDENTWKSPAQLLELLIESVSKGGNLLLNVGPTARGLFDARAQDRLKSMGDWMKYNNRSIYNCTEAPTGFVAPLNTLFTYNPKTNRLYVHLLTYPMGSLILKNMSDKVKYIQFLHDASEIKFVSGTGEDKNNLKLQLPVQKPPVEIVVLEVILK